MKMKYYFLLAISVSFLAITSCSKWLEVQPSDRVTEKTAFSSLQTFKKVLNGIYIEMNQESVYGRNLSAEFIDILAQYYAINRESRVDIELMEFNYNGASNMSRISSIWGNLYNLIANTNLLIRNTDDNRDVLTDDYYQMIKGEALALRAFFHFDLFRLFGPVYSPGEDVVTIPYYKDYVLDVEESLGATEYLEQVVEDLVDALSLLESDPIIIFGPKGDSNDSFKQFRTLRLNYYATKALLARVHLYMGNKELALKEAQEVMDVQERWFPWIKPEEVLYDRVFSSELLFSLQNLKRRSLFTQFFDVRTIEPTSSLSPLEHIALSTFNYERHDYRFMTNLSETVLLGNESRLVFNKYEAASDSLENQLIPLIRVSEVFYIAAESEEDSQLGITHLNQVRNNRGISESSSDWMFFDDILTSEYRREFWGEGQLFYYYKRRGFQAIPSSVDDWNDVQVENKNYVLPIPDGESKYN